ncbi:DUF6314 family protein [Palleronia caenipelagi]|uniref:Trigger factor n=1 Tax=Palleronia caenipelagi TaxID=2489174 RepID=A0A547Q315_9RHOB|nr:DUF6314 family protein [Palleronia caenipelagi]TRD20779.1 trigger factor [Palleronia caenipelagi]
MPTLNEFVGKWTLRREIEDRRAGQTGHFEGEARFVPFADGLRYEEEGTLYLGPQPMHAAQSHLWSSIGDLIRVTFSDGRPFHDFDASEVAPTARHDCAPDIYLVTYAFPNWPDWSVKWEVSGPRKDYTLRSSYVLRT